MVALTQHAQSRISGRLSALVTTNEVLAAALKVQADGRTYATVKSIPYTEIADPAVKPDGIARGDSIVAAVDKEGRKSVVVTVMLRKSWSKSARYDGRTL